ncbi:hypothetical protein ACX9MO_16660 [Pseudooceanicola sp. 502str34]
MIEDPRIKFSSELQAGARLCLLPFSRVYAEEPIQLAENLIFYPPGSLSADDLHVVSFPAHEWQEAVCRSDANTPGRIEASGSDLTWLKSGATQITIDDFFDCGLLALPVVLNWDEFLEARNHQVHLDAISVAARQAEAIIDLLRFWYCKIDLPDSLPGRAGYLPKRRFTAGLFYSLEDHESYIVAGQLVTHDIVAGLGLEINEGCFVPELEHGEVGNIARRGLRLHSTALEAASDTEKFLQLMTLIEYLADPDGYIAMQKVKKQIGRHVAQDRTEYDEIMQDFRFLTSMGKDSSGRDPGLRHNVVHVGANLEDLLDQAERRDVLNRVNRYIGVVLTHFIERSDKGWDAIEHYRSERGIALGLEADV